MFYVELNITSVEKESMTYIADLSICDYFGDDHGGHLVAVGWLDGGHEYPTGKMERGDYEHLERLLKDPFQPFVYMGIHECNICQFNGAGGTYNIFLPDDGDILVAPELILHYINCHGYLPPERFIRAMKQLSTTRNMAYKKKLLQNNGSFLIRMNTAQQGGSFDLIG